jgi:hypothetical protein
MYLSSVVFTARIVCVDRCLAVHGCYPPRPTINHHHQLNQKSIEYLIHRRQIHSTPNQNHSFTRLSLVEMAPNLSDLFGLSNPVSSSKDSYPVHNFQPKGHVIENLARDRLRAFTSDGQFSYLPPSNLLIAVASISPVLCSTAGKVARSMSLWKVQPHHPLTRDTCTSRSRAD